MADKAHLNGAYYGPSIPPPSRPKESSYYRPGRGDGFGCCLCSCLFSLICKIILLIVVAVGLAVFIFWLVVRPNVVKFHVTDAKLTQFNLTDKNNLLYNLALNITVRNPNKKIGVYYDRIEARAFYEGKRLDSKPLDPFYQGHKNTAVLSPVFSGQQFVLNAEDRSEFNQEKGSGVYSIDVKLYLRIRFKISPGIKTWRFKPKVECDLKVPLAADGKSVVGFERTKCDWDY